MGEGKRLSKMEQSNRDLRMVSEYRLGAKKGEIAERHGTHPKTVARAIGRFEEALPEELTGPTKLLEMLIFTIREEIEELALIAATSNDNAVRLRAIRQGLRHYAFLFKIYERLGMLPNLGPASPGWGREFAQGFLRWCGQQGVGGKPLPADAIRLFRGLLNEYLATLGEEPA